MKFHIGLASCVLLLVVGAMRVPASSSDGPAKNSNAIVSVARYVEVNGDTILELYSDGTVVVIRPFARSGPLHGRFSLKGDELTVTVPRERCFGGGDATSRSKIKNGEVDFGAYWWGRDSVCGKFQKK